MSGELERELEELRAGPADRSLDALEPAVWSRIEALRDSRKAASVFIPVRVTAVAGALLLGIAGGGLTAAALASEHSEISVFSIDAHLAPSTLLDRRP